MLFRSSSRIEAAYEKALGMIKANAAKGINETQLYIGKDIAREVADLLRGRVEGIEFLIVDRRRNEHTGQMMDFWGKTIDNERYYKVRIN